MPMSYYEDVYQKRLNRYGNNYQERILTQRRQVFSRRLLKSVYRIDFTFGNKIINATFERDSQNNTECKRYLFTEYNEFIPNGTILMLPDPIGILREGEITYPESTNYPIIGYTLGEELEDNKLDGGDAQDSALSSDLLRPWMVYYMEDTGARGYNRYIMLRMTHYITWKDRNRVERSTYAYMYGQEDNMLKDEILSRSRMDAIYSENLKLNFLVIPANEFIRKDDYFVVDKDVNNKVLNEFFRVTGYDIQSQDGVEYVSVDPIYEYATDFYTDLERPEIEVIEEGKTEQEILKEIEEKQRKQDEEFFFLEGLMKEE